MPVSPPVFFTAGHHGKNNRCVLNMSLYSLQSVSNGCKLYATEAGHSKRESDADKPSLT